MNDRMDQLNRKWSSLSKNGETVFKLFESLEFLKTSFYKKKKINFYFCLQDGNCTNLWAFMNSIMRSAAHATTNVLFHGVIYINIDYLDLQLIT